MKRLYEPAAYDTSQGAGSWWEDSVGAAFAAPQLDRDLDVDVAVIGGGYTGLNAALQMVEKYDKSVAILEAGHPAWGASGRNGGFACLGGAKLPVSTQIKRFGLEETQKFMACQLSAVDRVRDNLMRYDIAADTHSEGGELCLAHGPQVYRDFQDEADTNAKLFGLKQRIIPPSAMAEHGIQAAGHHGALLTEAGFALHPLKYAQGLAHAAEKAGIAIYSQSPALDIQPDAGDHIVTTPDGRVRAKTVIVATNGYSSDDIPSGLSGRFLPVLSSILVTRPITPAEQAAQGWTSDLMSYDSRNLLHYFRLLPDGRFLFGQRGARKADPAHRAANRRRNRADFERMFPAWADVASTHYWDGLICTTFNRHPYVGAIGQKPGMFAALGYHGNGVTMASHSGRLVADLAAGANPDIPAALSTPLWKFPVPNMRRHYLAAAFLQYRFSDWRAEG